MKRFVLVALCVAMTSAAFAKGKDDMQAGILAMRGGDNDGAIKLFASALAAGDLSNDDQAIVYGSRAAAYAIEGQYAKTFPDFDNAIRLKPDWPGIHMSRAAVYTALGQYGKAVADYDAALHIMPGFAPTFASRGVVRFAQGQFAQAAVDMEQSQKLDPNAYKILWLHIFRVKAGTPDADDFSKRAATIDDTQWPGPLIELYLGKTTAGKVHAAANADANAQQKRVCEADFYVGEYNLLHKDAKAAKPLLQAAAKSCPNSFPEYTGATAELKRIGG